jgi:REP element-mobilizing transposase RayT
MANTYTQLYIQYVFAVKNRESLIRESFREELHKYLTGIAQNHKHKMLAVYCMPDHTHIFVGMNPAQSISSLANDLKSNSSRWINEHRFCQCRFLWQEEFGAFSYHRNKIETICRYIHNQEEHHRKKKFSEEYVELLKEFEIDFNEKYLFHWVD